MALRPQEMSAPANNEKMLDLEQSCHFHSSQNTHKSRPLPPKSGNMPSIRQFSIALFLLCVATISFVSALPNGVPLQPSARDQQRFQELLNQVESTSLHQILHKYVADKYKHGIFSEDRKAIAAIHKNNAAEATSLVELARRQSNESSTVSTSTTTLSQTTSVSTTSTVITTSSSSSTEQSSSQTSQTTTPTTSTQIQTTSGTSTSTVVISSVVTSTATTSTAPTTGTTTKSTTSTSTTQRAISTSSKTTSFVYTTTYPNGGVATVTVVTVVPGSTIEGNGGSTSTSTRGQGGLQTGAANSRNVRVGLVLGMMGVAIAGAF